MPEMSLKSFVLLIGLLQVASAANIPKCTYPVRPTELLSYKNLNENDTFYFKLDVLQCKNRSNAVDLTFRNDHMEVNDSELTLEDPIFENLLKYDFLSSYRPRCQLNVVAESDPERINKLFRSRWWRNLKENIILLCDTKVKKCQSIVWECPFLNKPSDRKTVYRMLSEMFSPTDTDQKYDWN